MFQLQIKEDHEKFAYLVGYVNNNTFVTVQSFDRFTYAYWQVRAWVMKFVCNPDNNQYTW